MARESDGFEDFFVVAEPRLRRALVAAYGIERGREAAAEALAYGWEHWSEVRAMKNPTGYLYRIGQTRSRVRKDRVVFTPDTRDSDPVVEPGLAGALARLSERQRIAVVLVHGFGWQLREVAEVTGIAVSTIQNHVERGLVRLRAALEVHDV
jgi:DNA-directed RNA polymerase specialized sigma24 family protein